MNDAPFQARSILIAGDVSAYVRRLREELCPPGLSVEAAGRPADVVEQVARERPAMVILHESLSREAVLGLMEALRARAPSVPTVVVSEQPVAEWAVRYVRAGAHDYVGATRLEDCLEGLRRNLEALAEDHSASRRFFSDQCPPGVPFVGRSDGAVSLLQTVRMVALSRCNPVLIIGHTGTGKELVARAVHAWRSGVEAPFVAVNCAALTATLLESELFGHVKGAFTGADRNKTGLLEAAGGGSILLDEIGEMSMDLQAKLLRVVQERTFRKVGATEDIECKAAIIATSNRPLLKEATEGRFRLDLYYRLAVFPIGVPPLRSAERRADIPLLAEYFIRHASLAEPNRIEGLSPAAEQRLLAHDWPGNVRELRNVIERATLLEPTRRIRPESLRIHEVEAGLEKPANLEPLQPEDFSLETAEREFIKRALKETGWQRTRAAQLLGITRATLHAKIKRYDIEIPTAKGQARGRSGV